MLVDSAEKQLSIPEIIFTFMQELGTEQKMIAPYALAIVKETSLPNTDVRQYGNTVFISHFKTKDDVKAVFGRALNADTARNYLKNGEEYFKYLVDEGVDYFVAIYQDPRLGIIFRYIERPEVQARVGAKATVEVKQSGENYGATVKIEASDE